MNRMVVYICFYWPLLSSGLNFQGFVSKFVSVGTGQKLAYFNVALIIIGIFLIKRDMKNLSRPGKLWIVYYILYYCFALLASGIHGFESAILATFVSPIYFIGFYFLLSNNLELKRFCIILTCIFVTSAMFTIYFDNINFSYDISGVFGRNLDRAEGLYGDANNAALSSIIAYILFNKFYQPKHRLLKVIKIIMLIVLFYSLFITYSTTGLLAFTIIFFIINYRFFTGLKFILFIMGIGLFYLGIFKLQSQTTSLDLSSAQIKKIDNIINLVTLNLGKVDSSGRTDLIDNILYYLYQNPILGNGIDFSGFMRGHNTYLGVWVDAGLFTFLYFVFILIYYLYKSLLLKVNVRLFTTSILIVLLVFMMSLQSVLNQAYLIVLFVLIGYILDEKWFSKSLNKI